MKTKHSVILFFFLGLAVAIAGMVSLTIRGAQASSSDFGAAQEQRFGNDVRSGTLGVDQVSDGVIEGSVVDKPAPGAGNSNVCVSIPAGAFHSDGGSPDCFFISFYGGYINTSTPAGCCVVTPLNLPSGAEIYQFWISAADNSASVDLEVRLFRVNKDTGSVDTMALVATSGQSTSIGDWSDTTIDNPIVEYPAYSYYITTCLRPDIALYTVRVWYHPNTDATFKSILIQ